MRRSGGCDERSSFMIPLHVENPGRPETVSFQRQPPGWIADPGGIAVGDNGWARVHQPAGGGGSRFEVIGLAQEKTHDAMLAGAERQTAACSEIEVMRIAADLGEDSGQAAAA